MIAETKREIAALQALYAKTLSRGPSQASRAEYIHGELLAAEARLKALEAAPPVPLDLPEPPSRPSQPIALSHETVTSVTILTKDQAQNKPVKERTKYDPFKRNP